MFLSFDRAIKDFFMQRKENPAFKIKRDFRYAAYSSNAISSYHEPFLFHLLCTMSHYNNEIQFLPCLQNSLKMLLIILGGLIQYILITHLLKVSLMICKAVI